MAFFKLERKDSCDSQDSTRSQGLKQCIHITSLAKLAPHMIFFNVDL